MGDGKRQGYRLARAEAIMDAECLFYGSLAPLFRNEIRIAVTALLFLVNFLLPFRMLVLLVRLTTGQKRPAAHTTSRMLKAPPVVSAAIMMAADEMKCIRDLDTDCEFVL